MRRAGRRRDPWYGVEKLYDRVSQTMEDVVTTMGRMGSPVWAPPADVEETDDAYLVEVDVPGIRKNDVEVHLRGRELTVTGRIDERERSGVLHRRSRRTGRFDCRVLLPGEVDHQNVEATLTDGVLTVRVDKVACAQSRHIEVTGA